MKGQLKPITPVEIERANRRGEETHARGAEHVRLEGDRLLIHMRTGASASVPVRVIPVKSIAEAPLEKLSQVELGSMGDYVWFPDVDEGYNVAALLDLAFGQTIRAGIGARGGSKTSTAKAAAARANGARGGRPKSKVES